MRDGEIQRIDEKLSPDFLELGTDDEIGVEKAIEVTGDAYSAEDFLIVKLEIQAEVQLAPVLFAMNSFHYRFIILRSTATFG